MSTQLARDCAWRKYVSVKQFGGTPDEARAAFDRWWKLERAESVAFCHAEAQAVKRKQRRATSAPA